MQLLLLLLPRYIGFLEELGRDENSELLLSEDLNRNFVNEMPDFYETNLKLVNVLHAF